MLAWAIGLAVAALVAVPLGVLFGSVPVIDAATRAIVEFLRPIPSVALIPLVALLIGTGLQLRVTLVIYAAVWPILYNTMYGLRGVDPVARESLRSYGFGRLSVLWWVSLPSAAPFIMTGFRLATGVALILTVSTEIVAGRGEGIGVFIYFAGIAVLSQDGRHPRRGRLGGAVRRGGQRPAGGGRAAAVPVASHARGRRLMTRLGGALLRWPLLIVLVILWEVATRAAGSAFFPPPSTIVTRMHAMWFSGPPGRLFLTDQAVADILPSLGRMAGGLAGGATAGILLGLALGLSSRAYDYLDGVLQFLRAIPPLGCW
ncbi:ABC transporter permease subunit [Nonomuraea ferruginea]